MSTLQRKTIRGCIAAAAFLIALIVASLPPVYGDEEFILVLNNNISTESISQEDIRLIYLGKKRRWTNGAKIMLCYLDKPKILHLFSKDTVGKTSRQFIMYWKRMVFTGKSAMPKSFDTDQNVISYVKSNEGAIGFVSADARTEGVKVLKVEEE